MFEEQQVLLLVIVLGLWFVCGVLIGSASEVVEVKRELRALREESE